jgi:hypothetical protein
LDHRKAVEEDRGLSEYSFDYCFPGDEFGFKHTILVGRERTTGMAMATEVPVKGSSGAYAGKKVLELLEEVGDGARDVIIKTDQEPAVKCLVKDVLEMRGGSGEEGAGGRTILEESPVGSHGSNGIVERAVQGIEGHIRVMKSALEGRIGRRISAERRIVIFMADYAGYLVNRLEVGKDGKTAYERCKGKKAKVLGVEFGEKLLWKVKPKEKMEKINPRWEHGIFVGVRRASGEVWVATREGLRSARAVRRIPLEERWCEDCIEWVKNVPWNKDKEDAGADGEIPEEKLEDGIEERSGGVELKGLVFVDGAKIPREFQIKLADAEKHGFTRGCGGCSSWHRGLARQPHTEPCRKRFEQLLKDEARVKNAKRKMEEFRRREEQRGEKRSHAEVTDNSGVAASSGGAEGDESLRGAAAASSGDAQGSGEAAKRMRETMKFLEQQDAAARRSSKRKSKEREGDDGGGGEMEMGLVEAMGLGIGEEGLFKGKWVEINEVSGWR